MKVNPKEATETTTREPVPEGKYLCRVMDCKEKVGRSSGVPYLELHLEIQDGPHVGKIIYDNLSSSPGALKRTLLVFKRLTGIELDGEADIAAEDLVNCKANVTVDVVEEEYKGQMQKKNKIPFDGYESAGAASKAKSASKQGFQAKSDDDIPF